MDEQLNDGEEIRVRKRQKRLEEMRISKQKQMLRRMYMKKAAPCVLGAFLILFMLSAGKKVLEKPGAETPKADQTLDASQLSADSPASDAAPESDTGTDFRMDQLPGSVQVMGIAGGSLSAAGYKEKEADLGTQAEDALPKIYQAALSEDTVQLGAYLTADQEFYSEYAILIGLDDNNIIAEKFGKTRINPASMTKILTILVAAEHIALEDLDDKLIMTPEITDYGYIHDCSSAGFEKNETVTVRDMFYGTVLPSGADAAVGLAVYVAGSQDAFVELMNEKLKELGLSGSAHFTNCVGVYDEDHYCTAYDMAMIMEAAIDNELCRKVLTAHTYTTSITGQHPEGMILSNWFLRRIEDKEGGEGVVCAKTGYVVQSGSCAASYAEDKSGRGYVCVTAGADSQWRCIYDHAGLYLKYMS